MCLDVKSTQRRDKEGFPIPTTAKKDIICYKWLERRDTNKLYSPYYGNDSVKVGQRMKAKLGISNHSVNEGIHAYYSKKEALTNRCMNDVIVECIIPKGAQYIKGQWDEIVATEMKLKRIIAEGGKLKKPRNGNKN